MWTISGIIRSKTDKTQLIFLGTFYTTRLFYWKEKPFGDEGFDFFG
jgi:hypothetical protein